MHLNEGRTQILVGWMEFGSSFFPCGLSAKSGSLVICSVKTSVRESESVHPVHSSVVRSTRRCRRSTRSKWTTADEVVLLLVQKFGSSSWLDWKVVAGAWEQLAEWDHGFPTRASWYRAVFPALLCVRANKNALIPLIDDSNCWLLGAALH